MSTLTQHLKRALQAQDSRAAHLTAWLDTTEVLRWWKVAEQLPPLDVDVLVSWGDSNGTLMGAYILHHGWVGMDAMPLNPPPRYWCAIPSGPQE